MPKLLGARGLHILWTLYCDGPYIGETTGKRPLIGMAHKPPAPWAHGTGPSWHSAFGIRASAAALRASGLIRTRPVLNRKTGRAMNCYEITPKGRAEIERRKQQWALGRGLARTGEFVWAPVTGASVPEGRQRWWVPELVDMGWRVLLEYGEQWGWRFKLTRPDGKESGWIYCAKQDEQGAKAEAQATWKGVAS